MISEKISQGAHFFTVVHAFTKSLSEVYKLILCGPVVFIDMNTYTEVGMSFKTFLRENYAIALDSCYLFTKKMLNMKLNMILM